MASVMVANETQSQASRLTKEGKRITYRMHVIQQPERARACGSGAKSSADRRPVDPPPIVELRVYEGEGNAMQDITFSYNANFFLFATLENARVVAQGRVPTSPASFPVLTGTPVAGMAYLDRPNPAGYFIFPDLSVRHEGRYRLSFALYEELKNQNDMDPEDRSAVEVQRPGVIDAHVSHRLEVKSAPFTVFSAKKFPGLTESTALSRMVAEQGCRVRIRRDVRMRRRDTKSNKEWDDYEEETAYERARRTATPDAYSQQNISTPGPISDGGERPRSVSNASNASYAPQRRPSMQDMAQGYQPGYPSQGPPQAQQNGYPAPQMQYGTAPSHQYQNQFPPQQQQQQPQPQQPQSMMQPPHTPYQSGPSHHSYQQPPPQPQPSMQMAPPYGYMPAPSYNQPGYEQADHMRHNSVDYANNGSDYRRNTIPQPQNPQYPASNQMMSPYASLENSSNRASQPNQPMQPIQATPSSAPSSAHPMSTHSLAPLKTLQPPSDRMEPASPSYVTSGQLSAGSDGMHSQSYLDSQRSASSKYAPQSQAPSAGKRTFSESFDTKHLNEPLRQGARPNFSHQMEDYMQNFDEGEEEPMDERAMSYRRADGSQRMRRMPIANE